MVVGKVSEFIGSLYYLCVTLLRFKNIMKLKNYLLLLALLLVVGVRAQVPSGNKYPKREFRGAWIQAVNGQFRGIPTERLKQILISQLNSLQEAGINAIIFQVRPEADALYASQYEPWSRFLTGTQGQTPSPMWDPMQFMIEECQKRNMEFHAWINPYRVKTSLKNKLAPEHIYHQHPEWFVTYGDQLYFDPALPESREYICKIVTDIVSRYDVDAIHMDDYFYPYPVNGLDFPDDASFARYGGGFTNKADWRRSNVNVLIKKLHETIRGIKPWVKFGISPFGIYRNQKSDPLGSNTNGLQNYDDLYADVLLWAREGWIDYNIPQIYWEIGHKAADYETLVKWWATHSENRPLLFSAFVPHGQEDVLQFVYGISLYTDMHVAPVAYFRQTLYIVIGYVHATGISYFSVYDYNLAMVSVQGMIDIGEFERVELDNFDSFVTDCLYVFLFQWLVV